MDWIYQAKGRDKWQDVVNVVMIFGLHKLQQGLGPAKDILTSQGGLCPVESVICRVVAKFC